MAHLYHLHNLHMCWPLFRTVPLYSLLHLYKADPVTNGYVPLPPFQNVLTCCVGQEKRAEASKVRVSMKLAISAGVRTDRQRLMSKNTRKGLPLWGTATKGQGMHPQQAVRPQVPQDSLRCTHMHVRTYIHLTSDALGTLLQIFWFFKALTLHDRI